MLSILAFLDDYLMTTAIRNVVEVKRTDEDISAACVVLRNRSLRQCPNENVMTFTIP